MSRKFSSLLSAAVLTFSVAASFAAAPAPAPAAPPPGPPPARGRGGAAVPAGLGQAMNEMNRMLAAIKADATDPTKMDATLRNIATLERDVAIAKLLTPPLVNTMSADEKTKALAAYRTIMNGLTRALLDLEDAVVAKKPDDIKKFIAQVEEFEKKGHTEFRPAP